MMCNTFLPFTISSIPVIESNAGMPTEQRLTASVAFAFFGGSAEPVAFLALDPKGRVGAACTSRTNFKYAVNKGDKSELLTAKEVPPEA